MLRRHPQIFMPAVKEPRYLASRPARAGALRAGTARRRSQEYLALFADAAPDRLVGEASPSYLRSREAASAIAALQPNARIIALFREPASFVRSLHLHLLEEGVEHEPRPRHRRAPGAAGARRADGAALLRPRPLHRAAAPLPRGVRRPSRCWSLVYEEFRADNRGTLRTVLRFLGVDEDFELPMIEANPSYAVRSPRLNGALRSLGGEATAARAARRTLVALVPRRLRHGALGLVRRRVLYGPPPEPDERVMAELRERYRPEVEAFGEYLGRDLLTLWGYRGTARSRASRRSAPRSRSRGARG